MLTQLENRVLKTIREHIHNEGMSPTISEIAAALELRSRGTVHRYVQSLITKGELVREGTGWRGLKLAPGPDAAHGATPVGGSENDPKNDPKNDQGNDQGNDLGVEPGVASVVSSDVARAGAAGAQRGAASDSSSAQDRILQSEAGAANVDAKTTHRDNAVSAVQKPVKQSTGSHVPVTNVVSIGAASTTGFPAFLSELNANSIPSSDTGHRSGLESEHNDSRDGDGCHSDEEIAHQFRIPLLGSVAAGMPIEAIPDESHLDLAAFFIGPDKYALRVTGDSMIDAGIMDGDTVILRNQSTARSGDIVVALIDGQEATLKRLGLYTSDIVELIPENGAMSPMRYSPPRVSIQGVLIGQLRSY